MSCDYRTGFKVSFVYITFFCAVANEAMSQVVGRSEGAESRHHLSVLVRENNHHDNKLQLRAYTLTATVGHTTQPSGRSSVVSKCFASGGVHSKSIQRTSFGDSDSDFSGVDPAAYSRLFDSAKAVTVCCVSLPPSGDSHPTAILRCVLNFFQCDTNLLRLNTSLLALDWCCNPPRTIRRALICGTFSNSFW